MAVSNVTGQIKKQPKKDASRMAGSIINAAVVICLGAIFAPAIVMLALARGIVALGSLLLTPPRPKVHHP